MTTHHMTLRLAAILAIAGLIAGTGHTLRAAQEGASLKPDFSGRWVLNEDLSEDPEEKIENMREDRGRRGRGGPRGAGGGKGGGKGQTRTSLGEAQQLLRQVSRTLTITHDDPKVRFVESDGHIRTLFSDNREGQEGDHQIQTKWDEARLVSTIKVGGGTSVVESYELRPLSRQLVLNRRLEMSTVSGGRTVTVRLVYDAPVE